MRAELGAVMSRAQPGLPTANELCHVCVDVLGVDGAAISMVFGGISRGTYGSSSEASRRLDEYQFTFGEGPCLDAVAAGAVVHAPDLNATTEQRWPLFIDAVLGDGIQAVFALPVMFATDCVGALDLYRSGPGPLIGDQLAGGLLAAELAALPLLTLISDINREDANLTATTDLSTDTDEAVSADPAEPTAAARQPAVDIDRIEVYQATGMLIAQLGVNADEALARLRGYALATGRTASEVAYAILRQGLELERDDSQEGPLP